MKLTSRRPTGSTRNASNRTVYYGKKREKKKSRSTAAKRTFTLAVFQITLFLVGCFYRRAATINHPSTYVYYSVSAFLVYLFFLFFCFAYFRICAQSIRFLLFRSRDNDVWKVCCLFRYVRQSPSPPTFFTTALGCKNSRRVVKVRVCVGRLGRKFRR